MAAKDERLVGITPAMREGSGMVEFEKHYPGRFFDVGIAEQHAVTFAAGLACDGLKPVVAIYSTFLQRAYDQLIHDVALQNLPVVFAIDRAGLVGADGATHAGVFDIAYLRCIPNMSLACPADERECRQLLSTAFAQETPVAVRYPRGYGAGVEAGSDLQMLPFGKGEIRRTTQRKKHRVAILSFGFLLYPALEAAQMLDASVVNMRWVKPLDYDLLERIAAQHDAFVTVEDACVMGGAGSAVGEALQAMGRCKPMLQLGLPDAFVPHGEQLAQYACLGLDAKGIQNSIEQFLAKNFGEKSA
jgi:1-deoxy-D-xylulose-5-phosphate synthase